MRLTAHQIESIVDAACRAFPLKRKQRRDVNSVPGHIIGRWVFTLHKTNMILLALRPMVLSNLHQPERRVFVAISRFDKKDVLVGHTLSHMIYYLLFHFT